MAEGDINTIELTDAELAYITAAVGFVIEPLNVGLYAKLYESVFKANGIDALVKLHDYEAQMKISNEKFKRTNRRNEVKIPVEKERGSNYED